MNHPLKQYIRESELPTIFCPGCGCGQVLNYTMQAFALSGIDPDNMVFLSGGGCHGWIAPPFNMDVFHTNHGRGLAFATGIKIAHPKMKPVIFTGDGDIAAIGGNHLIHAARRNLDAVTICINNLNYGMTGGQLSPTTPKDVYTTTSPYGNPETPFDLCQLVEAAGATFIARWTTFHGRQLIKTIKKALLHKGFSFIEVISQCPTQFGRRLGFETPGLMMRWFKEKSTRMDGKEALGKITNEQIPVGEFVERDRVEFTQNLRMVYERVKKEAVGGGA